MLSLCPHDPILFFIVRYKLYTCKQNHTEFNFIKPNKNTQKSHYSLPLILIDIKISHRLLRPPPATKGTKIDHSSSSFAEIPPRGAQRLALLRIEITPLIKLALAEQRAEDEISPVQPPLTLQLAHPPHKLIRTLRANLIANKPALNPIRGEHPLKMLQIRIRLPSIRYGAKRADIEGGEEFSLATSLDRLEEHSAIIGIKILQIRRESGAQSPKDIRALWFFRISGCPTEPKRLPHRSESRRYHLSKRKRINQPPALNLPYTN